MQSLKKPRVWAGESQRTAHRSREERPRGGQCARGSRVLRNRMRHSVKCLQSPSDGMGLDLLEDREPTPLTPFPLSPVRKPADRTSQEGGGEGRRREDRKERVIKSKSLISPRILAAAARLSKSSHAPGENLISF